jgi:SAM-dependent methyltransferase
LADLARPHLGSCPIEIGSGTGDYALEWAGAVAALTATEADEGRLEALRARFATHSVIKVRHLRLSGAGAGRGGDEIGSFARETHQPGAGATDAHSALVALNVVEHIPDDVGALRAAARMVRPGGAVVLVVPAFPSAMSRFDVMIGHQRRYTRASLGAALAGAGLTVETLRYVNPLGLLNWYVTVKALRMTPRNGPALRLYDRLVVPVARLVDRAPMPFGQSVFAVARVP